MKKKLSYEKLELKHLKSELENQGDKNNENA